MSIQRILICKILDFWQLTIKTIDDLRLIGNENITLEMYIMQLTHLKNIETKIDDTTVLAQNKNNFTKQASENVLEKSTEEDLSTKPKNQLKNTDQLKTSPVKNLSSKQDKSNIEISSFQDLILKSEKEKEIELKFDLERNVKLVRFQKGKIDISFNEKLNKNFIKNLTEKLLQWTGERWVISLSQNKEAKSVYEKSMEKKSNELLNFNKSDLANEIKEAFPDAKLIDIKKKESDND